MSTDISVQRTTSEPENRSWLLSLHGTDMTPGVTLDVSAFTPATHHPNGFVPSGTVVRRLPSGLYGPYTGAAGEVPAGLLFSSLRVVNTLNGALLTQVGGAILIHGYVNPAKLPFPVAPADQAKLPNVVFTTA